MRSFGTPQSVTGNPKSSEPLPLSLLNDFLYCPRRAALKAIEGVRSENKHTVLGDIVHEHADLPGYELARGVTLLRALPVWSERLGLSGKCDVVERREDGSLVPIEYKKGKRRVFENDDAQLCAQALCLEEMFGRPIPAGAIFHAESRRRREVELTAGLRQLTLDGIAMLHALAATRDPPGAVFKAACKECSLYAICLPELVSRPDSIARAAAALFRT